MFSKVMKISIGFVEKKDLKSDVLINDMMLYFVRLWYTELIKWCEWEPGWLQ